MNKRIQTFVSLASFIAIVSFALALPGNAWSSRNSLAPNVQPFLYLPFQQNSTGFNWQQIMTSPFDHHYPNYTISGNPSSPYVGDPPECLWTGHSQQIITWSGIQLWRANGNEQVAYTPSGRQLHGYDGLGRFGFDHLWYDGHDGYDWSMPIGTPIYAAAAGDIVALETGEKGGWGYTIVIDHANGYRTRYAHLKAGTLKTSGHVIAGEQIAQSASTGGSTGPHLHFGVYHVVNGQEKVTDPFGFGHPSDDPLQCFNSEMSQYLWVGDEPHSYGQNPVGISLAAQPINSTSIGGDPNDNTTLPTVTPTPPPSTTPTSQDGIEIISVSSHTVQPGVEIHPSVTIRLTSGSLSVARGDHLHATPEDQSNTFGAWPVQAVKHNVGTGGTYTFDINNDSGFKMTAPNSTGQYTSVWRMRIGGNHIGPEIRIPITVQTQPSIPDGVILYDGTNYTGDYQVYTYPGYKTCVNLGGMNNRSDSIKLKGPYYHNFDAIMYGDDDCRTFNARFDKDKDDFQLQNNNFSSMEIEKKSWEHNWKCGESGVTFYRDPNYGGDCIHAPNPTYTGNLRDFDLNDSVSSIKIVGGYTAYLWEHNDRSGRMVVLTHDEANLSNLGFDDTASSVDAQYTGSCKQLQVLVAPSTGGSALLDSSPNCGDGFVTGSTVQFHATANANFAFTNWTGLATSSNNSDSVIIYNSGSITANFVSTLLPTAPSNLRITGLTQSTMSMAWDDTTNETGYRIYKWDGVGFTYLASVGADVTSYTDTGLNCLADYFYKVTSYNDYGESAQTDWVTSKTTGCLPPAFNKAIPSSGATGQPTNIVLYWNTNSIATSYEYCIDPTNDNACANNNWINVGFVGEKSVTGLANSTTYYWQVRGKNSAGTTDANGGVWWSFVTQHGITPTNTPGPSVTPTTPVPTTPASPCATMGIGTYEDNNANVCYSTNWKTVSTSGPSGGTYHQSNTAGSTAILKVNGAGSFKVTVTKKTNGGNLEVLVDGVSRGIFSTYYTKVKNKVSLGTFTLPNNGTHTITIRVAGTHEAASSGNVIALDTFVVLAPTSK